MKREAWLVLLAIGLLGFAGAVTYRFSSGLWNPTGLPSKLTYVCVATGEFFTLDRSSVPYVPGRNPKTGTETLVPVVKRDGHWFVTEHHRPDISYLDKSKANKYVDPSSLEVRAPQ